MMVDSVVSARPQMRMFILFFNLSRQDVRIRALGRKNQVDSKGTALTSNQRKSCFNLCQQFLTRFIRARLVKQFCHLVTGKDNTLHQQSA